MKINNLKVTNFRSFPKLTVFDLTYPENDTKRVTLVGGMNGAGKSSFMEALGICLYGKSKSDIYKCINNNELKNGNSQITFELEFETDDGDVFNIQRYWYSNKTFGEIKASDLEESLSVSKNGEIKQLTQETWQDFIEQTIPLGIIKFFFFDGEQVHELSETKNEGAQLKTDLESVLGIEIIRKLIEDLRKIESEIARNDNNFSSADLKKIEDDIEYANNKIVELENEKKERETSLSNNLNEISEIDNKIKKILGFNPELMEKKSDLNSRLTQVNNKISEINRSIEKYCVSVLPILLLSKYFPSLESQFKSENETKSRKSLVESSENIAAKIVDEAVIPVIPQMATNEQTLIKSKIIDILTQGKSQTTKIILDISDKEFVETSDLIKSAQSEVSTLSGLISQKNEYFSEKSEIETELEKVELPADKFYIYTDNAKKKSDLESENGRHSERLSAINDEIYKFNTSKEENQERQRKLIDQFEGSQFQKNKIQKYENIIRSLEAYVEIVKIDKLRDLENYILQMYKKLASKTDLVERVTVDEDTYEITVWEKDNQRMKIDSAGEKEVFTISLLWGLSQCTEFRLPVIIDTPLARLDSHHRTQIVKEYFPNASQQVIILSTDEEIAPNSQYYEIIKPYINKEITIEFDVTTKSSSVKDGYFLANNYE